MLVSGFGRSGHAVGDIPGVRFLVSVWLLYFIIFAKLGALCVYYIYILCDFFLSFDLNSSATAVQICFHYLQIVKVASVSLWALYREKKDKPKS